jgi:hypothetical protein
MFIVGVIAEGGGDFNVVVFLLLVSTVLSVTMGSVCATATDETIKSINNKFFI